MAIRSELRKANFRISSDGRFSFREDALSLDRVVKLPRQFRVNILERFVLGHGGSLVIYRVISEPEIVVSLSQAWSQFDSLFLRLNSFRISTSVVECQPEIEMS